MKVYSNNLLTKLIVTKNDECFLGQKILDQRMSRNRQVQNDVIQHFFVP